MGCDSMGLPRQSAIAIITVFFVATTVSAALTPSLPTIDQVYPQSATVGASIESVLEGNYLDRVQSVRPEDDELQAEVLESSFTRVRLRVSSRPGARPGLYGLRLITKRGISNIVRFRLTGWKSIYEHEPNDRETQATSVRSGTSVNGLIEHVNDSDFYKIHADTGETISFNMLIGRNGYANPGEAGHLTMTLLSSKGVVLATAFGTFLMDPYYQHRFTAAGDYYVVVNHSRMAVTCLENECDNRRLWEPYQLSIGRTPMLWSLWPNVVVRGTTVDAHLKADFLDAASPLLFSDPNISAKLLAAEPGGYKIRFQVGKDVRPGLHLLKVPDPAGIVDALGFVVESSEFRMETEPNDTREASAPLEAPAVIVGRLDHPGDVDSFQFAPVGTETVSFRLEARNLGSAMVDPNVSVVCKEGDLAAANDDEPSFRNLRNRDPYLEFKAADATACASREEGFYVQVRDSSKKSGDPTFYVLRVGKQRPSFTLGLPRDRHALERGKVNKIALSIRRFGGFTGDIHVTAVDVPPGIEAKPKTIGSGKASGEMEWRVDADAQPTPFALKLIASAEIDGKTVSEKLVLPQPMPGDGPGYVQTGEMTAWVSVVDPVQFALDRVPPPGAGFGLDRHFLSMRGDRKARVLLKIERAQDSSSKLEFTLEGLPEGLTVESQQVSDDRKSVEIVLKATATELPTREHRITIIASTKAGEQILAEATKAFYLRVEQ
jgi:hypothetical protein